MISFLFKQIHIFFGLTAVYTKLNSFLTDFNPLVKNSLNPKIQAEFDDLRREIEDLDPKLKE